MELIIVIQKLHRSNDEKIMIYFYNVGHCVTSYPKKI
jgi:hypothetical protein